MLTTGTSVGADLIERVDWWADYAREVDDEYDEADPVDLQLAEVVAGVLSESGLPFPQDDDQFLARLRKYGTPASGPGRGIIAATADGRLAVCVRPYPLLGMIESDGQEVAGIINGDPARYVEWWRLPAVLYLEAWSD